MIGPYKIPDGSRLYIESKEGEWTEIGITIDRDDYINAAEYLLQTLESHNLEVSLIPAPDPRHRTHKVRAVSERNPEWYRRLCKRHPANRSKPRERAPKYTDSLIRRSQVIKALKKIAKNKEDESVYIERLRPIVFACAHWLKEENPETPVFDGKIS